MYKNRNKLVKITKIYDLENRVNFGSFKITILNVKLLLEAALIYLTKSSFKQDMKIKICKEKNYNELFNNVFLFRFRTECPSMTMGWIYESCD